MGSPAIKVAPDVTENSAPVSLTRVLVALDASDHANKALEEAVRLAATADGVITGIHAYAAALDEEPIAYPAAALICSKDPQTFTGRILYDERLFRSEGMTFDEVRSRYPVEPGDRRRS